MFARSLFFCITLVHYFKKKPASEEYSRIAQKVLETLVKAGHHTTSIVDMMDTQQHHHQAGMIRSPPWLSGACTPHELLKASGAKRCLDSIYKTAIL
jgi:hypothetical protein